jgi:hypothetical protein
MFVYVMIGLTWAVVLVIVIGTIAHVAGGIPSGAVGDAARWLIAWLNNREVQARQVAMTSGCQTGGSECRSSVDTRKS